TIGGVGLMNDVAQHATVAFKAPGEALILIGATQGWLGQSIYLRDLCGVDLSIDAGGAPPPVDLATERRNGEFVRRLIVAGKASAVHDLSDGGLALALAEMAMAGSIGATLTALPAGAAHAVLFGEDQARYLLTCKAEAATAIITAANTAGVPAQALGLTGGDALRLPGEAPISVEALKTAHEGWFPAYMAG
ncbi:MAG: AIR synthase-related protein, partial [Bosea sp. (in: a-proteobacteria)]